MAMEAVYESSSCPVMAMEAVYEPSLCPVTAKEAICEFSLCPVTAKEAICELSPCPVTAKEAVCESSFCPVMAKEAVCELLPCSEPAMEAVNVLSISLVNPVMNPGTKRPFNVCPVNPITDKITTHELSVCSISSNVSELSVRPVLVIESSVVPSICPASINRSEYELSVLPVSVTELPTPASVNAPGYEHSACTKVAFESDVELSVCFKSTPASNCELSTQSAFASVPNAERFVCPTTLNEINTELSALSVTAQKPAFAPLNQPVLSPETINASHVFHGNSVTAIETIHELATCSISPSVSVEASALPVLVHDPVYELSFYPVSVSESINDCFVFPAMGPRMHCLCCLSLFSPDLGLCHGLLLRLLGSGGHLLRRGGLLLRSGGLLLCLLRSGGHLLRRGGLLLRSGGLLSHRGDILLCPGGLLFRLLRPGGLLSRLLHPGGLQSHLLRPGGLLSRLLRPGGLQSRLLRPGGLQSRLLRPGFLLCRLCLGPRPLHFHVDLALRPSPCSASAPPPSWIVKERLEAAPWGGLCHESWP